MITAAVKEVYKEINAALCVRYPTYPEMLTAVLNGDALDFIDEQIDVAVFSGRITDEEITEAVNDPEWRTWRADDA